MFEGGGGARGGGTVAIMVAVENPDDAAKEADGSGVGSCICHAQLGRTWEPISGHCWFPFSYINLMTSI